MLSIARFAFRAILPAVTVLCTSISFGQTAHPRVAMANSNVESASVVSQVESRNYDLSTAIAAYVKDSDLPADQAREKAIQQLFAHNGQVDFPVRREEVSPGEFKVWASQSFHALLPVMIEWITSDRKQIGIEARIVTISEHALKMLHAEYDEQWEFSAVSACETCTASDVVPATTQPTPHVTFASFNKQAERSGGFITAMSSTVQSLPGRVARLSNDQTATLINKLQLDVSSNLLHSPKITIFPGQHATIKDTTQRPFVVSVKPVKGGNGTVMQPVIRVLEEGLSIQLRSTLHGEDQLDIDSEITFNQIGDVDEFTFQSSTVQIPEQHMRQVRLSQTIDDGMTLLIDPHFFKETTTKKRFRRPTTSRQYTIVLLTPTIIHEIPDPIK